MLTAVCWSFNSVVFTRAGKRVGAVTVNSLRLWIALPALALLHGLLFGTLFPYAIEPGRLFYLAISGIIGFVIGDAMLFESFLLIGPRLAMLLALLAPVFSAVLAWVLLGEALLPLEIVSILVTIAGVAWVVAEETAPAAALSAALPRQRRLGILLAVGRRGGPGGGAAVLQAGTGGRLFRHFRHPCPCRRRRPGPGASSASARESSRPIGRG